MDLFLKFGEMTSFLILVLVNEVMMHRPILFHKPNKKSQEREDGPPRSSNQTHQKILRDTRQNFRMRQNISTWPQNSGMFCKHQGSEPSL